MIVFVLILFVIIVFGLKLNRFSKNDFLTKESTTTINGIFVMLIFLSHSTQYFQSNENIADRVYWHLMWIHNQWVVTTFLTFSGFGVMHKMGGVESTLENFQEIVY